MANTIITKNSATASAVPTSGDLVQGELAVNVTDKRLFTENSGGTVVELGTNPSQLNFADNAKAIFGDGSDLQIYHDGTHSRIVDAGTGNLHLQGDNLRLKTADSVGTYLEANNGGAVTITYNSSPKLATTSTGIDVTGTVVSDGLTVDGTLASPAIIRINNSGGSWVPGDEVGRLQFYTTDASGLGAREVASIRTTTSGTSTTTEGTLEFWRSPNNGNVVQALNIDGDTGDISFYEDTGTTAKFFWDASAESLGIGTSSPTNVKLQLNAVSDTVGTGSLGLGGGSSPLFVWRISSIGDKLHLDKTYGGVWDTPITINRQFAYVGIGTTSPYRPLQVKTSDGATALVLSPTSTTTGTVVRLDAANEAGSGFSTLYLRSHETMFYTGGTERLRIDSSGNLLVGTTSSLGTFPARLELQGNTGNNRGINYKASVTGTVYAMTFNNPNGFVGNISVSGSSTSYVTSSDYRLKEDWQPMTGASERVKALKPVNFAWKADGSRVDGFLAHEAAEVVPEAVTGEKDAVDAEGKPVYQGIDQSKLVPLLTAALQEALAQIESLTARVSALEGN